MRPPRRLSGPARRPAPARATRSRRERRGGILLELLSALERLSSHRLIDRLIRGRAWLVMLTFALIGIVTLQLGLLKLNGSVGRTLRSEALLQRENASLSIENSELSAADKVQSRASQIGMAFASSSALRSLAANPRADYGRAAAALRAAPHASGTGAEGGASAREGGASARERASGGEGSGPSPSAAASERASSEAPTGGGSSASAAGAASQASPSRSSPAPASSEATTPPQVEPAAGASGAEPAASAGGGAAAPHG